MDILQHFSFPVGISSWALPGNIHWWWSMGFKIYTSSCCRRIRCKIGKTKKYLSTSEFLFIFFLFFRLLLPWIQNRLLATGMGLGVTQMYQPKKWDNLVAYRKFKSIEKKVKKSKLKTDLIRLTATLKKPSKNFRKLTQDIFRHMIRKKAKTMNVD